LETIPPQAEDIEDIRGIIKVYLGVHIHELVLEYF
jgi:hypothetical protein